MFSQIKKILGLLAVPALLLVGTLALAGNTGTVYAAAVTQIDPSVGGFTTPAKAVKEDGKGLTSTQVRSTLQTITNIAAFIVAAIAVILIIVGAFQWLSGNEKEGKQRVVNAVVGLAIIFFAWFAVQFLVQFLTGLGGGTAADGTTDTFSK